MKNLGIYIANNSIDNMKFFLKNNLWGRVSVSNKLMVNKTIVTEDIKQLRNIRQLIEDTLKEEIKENNEEG